MLECFKRVEPRFDLKKADAELMNSILAWIWKKDSWNMAELDYDKGLFLYGPLGVGKSMTLVAMQKYMNEVCARHEHKRKDYRMKAIRLTASELANIYAVDGQPGLLPYAGREMNLMVDELGREPCPAKYFGTEMNVIQFLFQLRYDNRHTCITHVTTNIELQDIAAAYGDYIADRFLEMFNFISLQGNSFR